MVKRPVCQERSELPNAIFGEVEMHFNETDFARSKDATRGFLALLLVTRSY